MEKESKLRTPVINIPKQRVYNNLSRTLLNTCPSSKRKLWTSGTNRYRKPSEVSFHKYSLPGDKPLRVERPENEGLVLSFREYARKQRFIRHKQKLDIKARDEYKIISTDLKKRLHIKHEVDDINTITDIDEDFFNYINGRMIARHGVHFKSLQAMLNYGLRKRIEIGYRKDTIFSIDVVHRREQSIYEASNEKCKEQINNFDRFISEDYKKSMEFLREWEELKQEVDSKNIERQILCGKIFNITSILIGLDHIFNSHQKYGRFLYYLSPPAWRAQNREFAQSVEIENTGFEICIANDGDTFTVMFDKLQRLCATNAVKPVLYFTHPSEMMSVFDTIEMQLQYNFAHVTSMAPFLCIMNEGVAMYKDMVVQDADSVASSIKGFATLIDFYDERSRDLEVKFFKILNGLFYQSVAAPDVLEFTVHLEFCFEQVYNEKPLNKDIRALAKGLEDFYFGYRLRLEALEGEEVKEAIRKCHKEDKQMLKKSREAARELRLFRRLEHELLIAFSLPSKKEVKPVTEAVPVQAYKKRKSLPSRKLNQPKPSIAKKRSVTDSELEYLRLFTDWTEKEDPSLYLLNSVYAKSSDSSCGLQS